MHTPVLGLHFKVSFDGDSNLKHEIDVQEVTGLGASLELETLEEGGNTFFTYNLPKKTKNEKIILKRALCEEDQSKKIIKWAEDAIYNFDFKPLDLSVVLLNDKHEPIKSWNFFFVIPTKIDYSGMNAISQSLIIETLELNYLRSSPNNN